MTFVELVLVLFVSKSAFGGVLPNGDAINEPNLWELSGKFEGDMVFALSQRNGLVNTQYRWPNRVVPYEINQATFSTSNIKLIENALQIIGSVTCIQFRRRLPTDRNYVYVKNNESGCWSYIGRIGGRQNLNLGSGCVTTGIIIHEFLHVLGFLHQHSDSTRDNYVKIYPENIIPGATNNFQKYSSWMVTSFGESYDYDSIMHYSKKAFSKNGLDTIVPLNPFVQIGQRNGLSSIDIRKINRMYNCWWLL